MASTWSAALIALLLWWAVERNAISAADQVLAISASADSWQQPMTREVILPRLMRRYAAEGTKQSLQACARILRSAPNARDKNKMVAALDQGLPAHLGFSFPQIPSNLEKELRALLLPGSVPSLRVLARLGDEDSRKQALEMAADKQNPSDLRIAMLGLLGELAQTSSMGPILNLVMTHDAEPIQLAACSN